MDNIEEFENKRWQKSLMELEEHHRIALGLIEEDSSVLDLGCGDGVFLSSIKSNKQLLGIDCSQEAVNKCISRGINAIKGDVNILDKYFINYDYVCLLEVLEHTLTPVDMLKNASYYGNIIIISVPNFSFIKDRLYSLFGLVPPSMKPNKGHCFYMTKRVLEKVCFDAGLKIIDWKYYYPLQNRFKFLKKLNILSGLLSTLFVVRAVKYHPRILSN